MEAPHFIQVSHESNIMMSSEMTNVPSVKRWKFPLLIGLILAFLAVLTVLGIGLSAHVSIPEQPMVLIYTSPARLRMMLSSAQQTLLPPAWQSVIATQSHWPVIFGLTRENDRWMGFAIGPRWAVRRDTPDVFIVDTRFIRAAYDSALQGEVSQVRYFESIQQRFIHPFSLFSANIFPPTDQVHSFHMYEKNRELYTDLSFKGGDTNLDVKQADLSLNLYQDNLFSLLASQVRIGSQTIQSLSSRPQQISLQVDDQLNPTKTSIVFSQPLRADELGKLFSSFGIQTTRIITLPDGTQALDRSALLDIQGEFSTTTKYGELRWTGTELILGQSTSSLETAVSACPELHLALRLSKKMVGNVLGVDHSASLPHIQLGEKKGNLVICMEK